MLKLALTSIRRRKARFALIMLAVASGVGLYFGSLVLVDSLKAEAWRLEAGVETEAGKLWSAQETDFVLLDSRLYDTDKAEAAAAGGRLDAAILATLEETGLQVEAAAGFIEAFESIVILQGDRVLKRDIDVSSFSEDQDFNDFSIVKGRPPGAIGQIALGEAFASEYYMELGEVVTLKYQETKESEEGAEEEGELRSRDFEVVGFTATRFRSPAEEGSRANNFNSVILLDDLRYLLGYEEDQLSRISVKVELAEGEAWTAEDFRAVNEKLPSGVTARTSEEHFSNIDRQADFLFDIEDFSEVLEGLVRITIVIAIFMIFNVFSIVSQQRTRELALLRALSFSRFRTFRLIMTESLAMALAATAIGLAMGTGVSFLIIRFSGVFFENAPASVELVWDWRNLIWPAVLGVTVTLTAGLLPAWRAARLRPAAVLAGQHSQFKSFKWRLILGLILLGLGSILVVSFIVEHRADLSNEVYAVLLQLGRLTFGGLLTFGGIFILMPIILHFLLRASGRLLRPLAGTGLNLVLGNLGRQVRHSSININMVIIIIAMMVGALISLQSLLVFLRQNPIETFVNDWALPGGYENEEGARFIPPEAIEELTASKAIANLTRLRFMNMIETEPLEGQAAAEVGRKGLNMQALDTDSFRGFLKISKSRLSEDERAILVSGKILVRDEVMRRFGWRQDQKIKLVFEAGSEAEYVIGGVIEAPEGFWRGFDLVLDSKFHASQLDDWPVSFIFFDTADGYSHQDVAEILKDMQRRHRRPFFDTDFFFSPIFEEEFNQEIDLETQQQISSLGNFFVLPFAVALFGMACTLSLAVSERQREIGILRALGFGRRQIQTGVFLEAASVILIGILIGGSLGMLFAWMFQLLLESLLGAELFRATFTIPWLWLGIYGLAGFVLAGLASLWPAIRASRLNIVQALSNRL